MNPPFIANIVVSSDFGTKINLILLKDKIPEIKYNPGRFAAGIFKIKDPHRSTFLIWKSGKIICLGCKEFKECENVFKHLENKIKKFGFPLAKYNGFAVQNIVSSFNSGNKINLGEFSMKYRRECFYEPEIFCGLHFKVHPRMICLIFASGKIVITGCKNIDERDFMYKKIKRYLF